MPNRSKNKGSRIEREVVALIRDAGVYAERVPLSGAAGGSYTGDVVVGGVYRAEVKARAAGSGFKTLERWMGDNDFLVLRRDKSAPLVLMGFDTFLRLLEDHADAGKVKSYHPVPFGAQAPGTS